MEQSTSLVEKLLRNKIQKGIELTEDELLRWYQFHPDLRPEGWVHPSEVVHEDDLIPDIVAHDRSEEEEELDRILAGIGILEAYDRWGKKNFRLKVGSKRESIMIRCPDPAHEDKKPSAYINLDKEVYHCAVCEYGGDKFDIAAFAKGYAVPGYKTDGSFPKLKRDMAEDFGWTFNRTPGGATIMSPPDPVPAPEPEPEPASDGKDAPIIDLHTLDEDPIEVQTVIDWQSIIPPETFLWEWMTTTCVDDLADEYYFWLGMQAIATAVGANMTLSDFKRVKPNLYLCIYGKTGSGKSRSIDPFLTLVNEALPWDGDAYTESTGTLVLSSPQSAEALLHSFVHEIQDPSTNAVLRLSPVRGLLKVEEFASFVAKASRPGNPLKETLIELYDADQREVSHKSMSGGVMRAKSPFCQMLTTTQPRAIHAFMRRTDTESGFMNRWIFVAGTPRRSRISYGGVRRDLTGSIAMLKGLHAWANGPREMELEGDALKVWDSFYHEKIGPLLDTTDESMLSRVDLHLKKVIILFTANEKQTKPTADIVERACSLFEYLVQTLTMFSRDVAHDEIQDCQKRIMTYITSYIEKTGDGPTRRDLIRAIGHKFTYEQIEKSLKILELLGLMELKKHQGKRGPVTHRYVLHA